MDQNAAKARLEEHWKQVVLEGNQASVSKREWCRQNGISEKTFFYWQRRFRKSEPGLLGSLSATPDAVLQKPKSTFVELPFSENPNVNRSEDPSLNTVPEAMIQFNGCQVYINGAIQESTLRTVLKVVRDA